MESKVVDALTLTRVWARVQAAADEAEAVFRREAFSTGLSVEGECASVVFGPDGTAWTQGSQSNPFQSALLETWIMAWRGWELSAEPGTVYVSNDPYCGGSSLCDLRMVAPFFVGGQRAGLMTCAGHLGDLGGRAVGGVSPGATDVQQEGVRLTPVMIAQGWRLDRGLVDLLAANSRFPEAFLGDFQAMVDGLQAGVRRMEALFARFGTQVVMGSVACVAAHTQEAMAATVAEIQEGDYLCRDRLDGDGVVDAPIWLRTCVRVDAGRVHFDFRGSSGPTLGPMNCSADAVRAACLVALRHLFPEVPRHGAVWECLDVTVAEASFLDARFPRAVGGATPEVVARILCGALEALSQGVHGRGVAGSGSGASLLILQGIQDGDPYLMRLTLGGGGGASGKGDGLSNGDSGTRFTELPPLERIEREYPIRVETYALRPGSGGAGRYLGGMGTVFEFEVLEGPAFLTLFCDRFRRGPGGLQRGARGEVARVQIFREGHWQHLPHQGKVEHLRLERGDRVRIETAGGGGYGHPYERAIRLVSRDVQSGILSRRAAALAHGVIFHSTGVMDYDSAQTFQLRSYRLTAADVEGIVDDIEEMEDEK